MKHSINNIAEWFDRVPSTIDDLEAVYNKLVHYFLLDQSSVPAIQAEARILQEFNRQSPDYQQAKILTQTCNHKQPFAKKVRVSYESFPADVLYSGQFPGGQNVTNIIQKENVAPGSVQGTPSAHSNDGRLSQVPQ